MTTRTVNIALIEAVPQVRTLVFKPRLASVDGGVLLRQQYTCVTNSSGVGTINLPVKTGSSIRYDFEIPKVGGKDIGHFVISDGSAVTLDALIAAGGSITDSVIDYGNTHWGGGGGGNVATDVIFDAKGDLPVGTGADTAAKLTAGANDTFLVPDSAQTTGLKWINAAAVRTILGLAGLFQPLATALTNFAVLTPSNDDILQCKSGSWTNRTIAQIKTDLSLTGTNSGDQFSDRIAIKRKLGSKAVAETVPFEHINGAFALTSGFIYLQAINLSVAKTLADIQWWQAIQGVYTASNNNKIGLYSYDGAGTLNLVASSANDGNLWKGATQSFPAKAFSSTYAAAKDAFVIALLYNSSAQTTAPSLVSGQSSYVSGAGAFDYPNSAKSIGYVNGSNTDLPSTIAMTSVLSLGIPIALMLREV